MLFSAVSLLFAVSVCLAVYAMNFREGRVYLAAKCWASFLFLVLAVLACRETGNPMFYWMMPGFLLCFAGDAALAWAHEIDNRLIKKRFYLGVGLFLAAHLVFTAAFWLEFHGNPWMILGVALLVLLITLGTTRSPRYEYGTNKGICLVYSFFIGLFCGSGVWLLCTESSDPGRIALGLGAVLFMLSDLLLSVKYFSRKTPKSIPYLNLPVYYLAVYLLIQGMRG